MHDVPLWSNLCPRNKTINAFLLLLALTDSVVVFRAVEAASTWKANRMGSLGPQNFLPTVPLLEYQTVPGHIHDDCLWFDGEHLSDLLQPQNLCGWVLQLLRLGADYLEALRWVCPALGCSAKTLELEWWPKSLLMMRFVLRDSSCLVSEFFWNDEKNKSSQAFCRSYWTTTSLAQVFCLHFNTKLINTLSFPFVILSRLC
jgi:hypothetical protein